MSETFTLKVNGIDRQVSAEPNAPLVYLLRNDLGLKGTRFGCGSGHCGACTVLVDGNAVQSCDTPLWSAVGREVTTIEGLGSAEHPHPLQQAFLDEQAAQCGYCINGIMMSAAALLRKNRDPSDAEIAAALDRNLCRCGTHVRILRAIRRVRGTARLAPQPIGALPPSPQPSPPTSGEREPGTAHGTARLAPLPANLKTNPRLDRWVRFDTEQAVTIFSGKVEIGQGIVTALAQVAAEELDVALERVVTRPTDTSVSPNEGFTAGSMSVEMGASAMRMACAEVRKLFLEAAARRLEVSAAELTVRDGMIEVPGTDLRTSYWALAGEVSLACDATGEATPKPAASYAVVGRSAPRRDLPAKLTGAAYVHDMSLPGMVHGRVLRPPSYSARLTSFDAETVRAAPGVVAVVVNGSFLGICAGREEQAVKALEIAGRAARWEEDASMPAPAEIRELLPQMKAETRTVTSKQKAGAPAVKRLEATYSRPYLAHASIGPSCAAAAFEGGKITVWSHAQGPFPLRGQIARVLGMKDEDVTVVHRDGAGCYGHNGADDAALDAALLARACGRPVLLQWTREDELAWSPFGSAMVVKLAGSLDGAGTIVEWKHELWSHSHVRRPGAGDGVNLLAAWHLDPPFAASTPRDAPWPPGAGDRNSPPIYDIPHEVLYHFVPEMPLRVSALRTLGAFANVFAIESFMDELAAAAGADPVAFRLKHLADPRARAVIDAAARAVGWQPEAAGDGTRGRGIGFARYKNASAYCAVIAEVEVAEQIRLRRAVAAVDAGGTINPDGLKNQIEGGIVQAASWTLKEAVGWDATRVLTRSWEDYPILKFDEVPEVEVVIVDRPGEPGLGAGECSAGPTAAAIANALAHALGVRARDLPLTSERVAQAMG